MVNTIQYYTVEPLWGFWWRWDAFSTDCTYGLSGVIHIKPLPGMLLICATGGINNLPFRGIIQFMAIHQSVAFGLKIIAILGADL